MKRLKFADVQTHIKEKKLATIKDISKETGLGLATISKYLNGGNVLPENKILIENAINKLDYKVNAMARGLKTNKSNMVGIVIPELSNLFTTTIISDIEDVLRQKGYGVIVADCRSDEKLEEEKLEFMLSKQIDGLIYVPVSSNSNNIEFVKKSGIPIVLIDRKLKNFNCDFVGIDNVEATKKAVDILIENGHKNIAFIAGPNDISTAKERLEGYEKSLTENNVEIKEKNIYHANYTVEEGYKSMIDIIENNQEITAVFASNYESSVGAVMAINEKELKIPEDLSLVGFDSIELSKVMNPKLTIISQPMNEIAKNASRIILERLANNGEFESVVLDSFIEYGKSIKRI